MSFNLTIALSKRLILSVSAVFLRPFLSTLPKGGISGRHLVAQAEVEASATGSEAFLAEWLMMHSEKESVSFGTKKIYPTAPRGCLLLTTLGNQMLNSVGENTTHYKSNQLEHAHMECQKLSASLQLWDHANLFPSSFSITYNDVGREIITVNIPGLFLEVQMRFNFPI